jgi:hypothetical protein
VAILFRHGSTETRNYTKRSQTEGLCGLLCFGALVAIFSATEARKHGIALKDFKQKALVGFSALVLWWLFFFLPRKHGNTEFHQKISK